ncbi:MULTISPECIES: acetyl-CoA carboxylase biotin carboxylase subunit [unclassified Delftia]|uniref:acetyl-CoA carboxylase biotin carboxylase subunit n=1 Tax=unclassified Delftia TaxID=2613839 RepID=UPI0006481EE4|nr:MULTISPECIES: biotin carboxylase N-terminal domain-containing protein [unclassified Delftia]MDC2857777.1 ATP-grasp domain-containing protein [Delftia sp. DT-2]
MSGAPHPIRRVLVANRGAVAARVIRTLRRMGLESVAVYSEADAGLPYVRAADQSVCIGPAPAAQSYLDQARLLQVARETGADAVHPGYGFLSENAEFAEAVQRQGLCFIGPSPHWIRALGHKTQARAFMAAQGMPQAASSAVLHSVQEAQAEAARIGFPVLVKPAGGGGGIGMLPAHDAPQLEAAWSKASGMAAKYFGTAELYLEKLIEAPRHIEFQVLADRHGEVRVLFERDCSVQRRHQKVVEEARPAGIPAQALADMRQLLAGLLARTGYDVIGTVEMLYTPQHGFVFLEMNTRLQVEHAVTEEITGIDIVEAQIRLAAGERMREVLPAEPVARGHAIEARIYAEDPVRFLPSPGRLDRFEMPQGEGLRVETGYAQGCSVTPFYDPMVAKLVAHGSDRAQAIARLRQALAQTRIEGVKTNIPFIERILGHADFLDLRIDTGIAQRVLAPL